MTADENEPTRVPDQPGVDGLLLTGGPDREYRSGEIEPSQVIQAPAAEGDWEEKTVVDDSQLYNTKEGPSTLSIGTTTSDDELTIDEPNKSMSPSLPRPPAAARPAAAPGRPAPAAAPGRPAPAAGRGGPAPARPAPLPSPPATQVPEAAQGKLVVIAGNDTGREFPLQGKTITVGRGIDNDVVLTDIAVSRKHMSIAFDGSRYQLTDQGSGNGTIINQRVETGSRTLSHADRIEIGNTVFRFEHPAGEKQSWAPAAPAAPLPKTSSGPAVPSGLPLPASPPPPASPESSGLPLPPPQHASGPPATLTGSSPIGDLAFERPLQESAQQPEGPSPWSPPPVAPSPAAAPAIPPTPAPVGAPGVVPGVLGVFGPGLAAHVSPTHVPLVPYGPLSARKLLVGATATLVGLIAIAVGGMMIGGDQSPDGQTMEPPVNVEEMLFSWIAPVLELGDASGALPPGIDLGTGLGTGPASLGPGAPSPSDQPAGTTPAGTAPAGTAPAP
jgi:hypothetical protein